MKDMFYLALTGITLVIILLVLGPIQTSGAASCNEMQARYDQGTLSGDALNYYRSYCHG
jgi:hypothetical protein